MIRWLEEQFEDPTARAKLLRIFWVISFAMLVLGYALILLFWIR